MRSGTRRRLLRRLQGELSPEEGRVLEEELRRFPALRRELAGLEQVWESLEPGPTAPAPPDLAERILARVAEGPPPASPSPVALPRAAAALLAVALGMGGGVGLGLWAAGEGAAVPSPEPTLADRYWQAVESTLEEGAGEGEGEGE